MEKQKLEGIYLFLISILPISIIVGPSISLLNILLIVIVFLVNFKLDKIKLKNQFLIYLLLTLYVYLIFNSFISIDYKEGIFRNLGFIRFIILFIAINFFFTISKNNFKFINFWSVVILIVVFDFVVSTRGRMPNGKGGAPPLTGAVVYVLIVSESLLCCLLFGEGAY